MSNYDNEGNGLLFDFPKYKINKKIRLIELFGGIGSQAMALRDIGADFEYYRLVEFDKYAVQAYNAIHNTQHTTHDIRQTHAADLGIVETDKYCYLMTYSFPCTDLSVAGKMQGMSKTDWQNGNATRSGLLWEVERILKECDELPQVLLMENVPQVHAEQNRADFESWLNFLRGKGYHNFYKDLNAKDYGIPQNRDRCFCVSILSPDFIEYDFPETVKLESVMKDYLEESVDEKYYINTEKAKKLIDNLKRRGELKDKDCVDLSLNDTKKINISNAITAREDRSISNIKQIGNGVIKELGFMPQQEGKIHQSNKVYDTKAISPCLNSVMGTHNNITKIVEEKVIVAMRGRNPEILPVVQYRIRKLTPKECWRLMGYTDADFDKAQGAGVSNSQLYKQAGNAIVKQVLMAIFAKLIY